jgi:hypothetical protein
LSREKDKCPHLVRGHYFFLCSCIVQREIDDGYISIADLPYNPISSIDLIIGGPP